MSQMRTWAWIAWVTRSDDKHCSGGVRSQVWDHPSPCTVWLYFGMWDKFQMLLLLPRDVPHKLRRWVESMKSVCRGNIEICFCSIFIYFLYIYRFIWFIYLSSPSSSPGIYLSIHLSLLFSILYLLPIYISTVYLDLGWPQCWRLSDGQKEHVFTLRDLKF